MSWKGQYLAPETIFTQLLHGGYVTSQYFKSPDLSIFRLFEFTSRQIFVLEMARQIQAHLKYFLNQGGSLNYSPNFEIKIILYKYFKHFLLQVRLSTTALSSTSTEPRLLSSERETPPTSTGPALEPSTLLSPLVSSPPLRRPESILRRYSQFRNTQNLVTNSR